MHLPWKYASVYKPIPCAQSFEVCINQPLKTYVTSLYTSLKYTCPDKSVKCGLMYTSLRHHTHYGLVNLILKNLIILYIVPVMYGQVNQC